MGGSTDVDEAFLFMISRAKGGDFLIVRADDDDLYNPYVWNLAKGTLNSVATLCLFNRTASFDPLVAKIIRDSEAIFLAGGDQWVYIISK